MSLRIGDRVVHIEVAEGDPIPSTVMHRYKEKLDLGTVIRVWERTGKCRSRKGNPALAVVWDTWAAPTLPEVDDVQPNGALGRAAWAVRAWGTRNASSEVRARRASEAEGRLRAAGRRVRAAHLQRIQKVRTCDDFEELAEGSGALAGGAASASGGVQP